MLHRKHIGHPKHLWLPEKGLWRAGACLSSHIVYTISILSIKIDSHYHHHLIFLSREIDNTKFTDDSITSYLIAILFYKTGSRKIALKFARRPVGNLLEIMFTLILTSLAHDILFYKLKERLFFHISFFLFFFVKCGNMFFSSYFLFNGNFMKFLFLIS